MPLRKKVYYGIPKSKVDRNTVFYASLDGTTVAEVGSSPTFTDGSLKYVPFVTGSGISSSVVDVTKYNPASFGSNLGSNGNDFTIDIFVKSSAFTKSRPASIQTFVNIIDGSNTLISFGRSNSSDTVAVCYRKADGLWNYVSDTLFTKSMLTDNIYHIRVSYNHTNRIVCLYMNGSLSASASNVDLYPLTNAVQVRCGSGVISDVHISNIDRGSLFPQLPSDFISGYATIRPPQEGLAKKVPTGNNLIPPFSDSRWSIHTNAKVISDYELELNANGNWQASLIDIPCIPNTKYTISSQTPSNSQQYFDIYEGVSFRATTSTGSPATFTTGNTNTITLKVLNGAGALGKFTFTNPMLTLGATALPFEPYREGNKPTSPPITFNMPSTSTMLDFVGKVSGSVVENPNIVKVLGNTTLQPPSIFGANEIGQASYNGVSSLDSTLYINSSLTNGAMWQVLFSFDLIKKIEKEYGKIPSRNPVQWLKDNLSFIFCNWWGYGSSPTGNKATLLRWKTNTSLWDTDYPSTHTTGSVSKLTIQLGISSISNNVIDANGFVHFLAYADPSDGVTASAIRTDFVNLELTFKQPVVYPTSHTIKPAIKSPQPKLDTLLSDNLTAQGAWTIQSGNFTFGSSGATSGASGSILTQGNYKPHPNIPLSIKVGYELRTGIAFQILLSTTSDWKNYYRIIYYKTQSKIYLDKITNNSIITTLASQTGISLGIGTFYLSLNYDVKGNLIATLIDANSTQLAQLTVNDTSLLGNNFAIGVGGDTGVVISQASVTGARMPNLIPPFTDLGWNINSQATVIDDYTLSLNAVSGWPSSTFWLNVSPNTTYTITGNMKGSLEIDGYDRINGSITYDNYCYLNSNGATSWTFTTNGNTVKLYIQLHNNGALGTFNFQDLQLTQTPTAKPFQPYQEGNKSVLR